ncbi:MAG: RnfABCDGE type electron transport complex subunit D [Nitrospinota bacterium]
MEEAAANSAEKKEMIFVSASSPHVRSGESVGSIMRDVIIALMPATIAGVYIFGLSALYNILAAVVSALLFESIYIKWMGAEGDILDGSAVLTGLLLALTLPPNFPLWGTIIGSFFAIIIVKQIFGGLGYNIFNPALAARVFLSVSWPAFITTFPDPVRIILGIDAITEATPLSIVKASMYTPKYLEAVAQVNNLNRWGLFLGNKLGCIGEVSVAALLLGGLYLLYKKVITWHIPVSFILSLLFFNILFNIKATDPTVSAAFHLLSGGLMIGAIYMATDYVTSPMTERGMLVFGIGCGFLTIMIRMFGGYPEGVSFAILIMNMFTPMIDRYVKIKRFGGRG